jgi:hypothetical protein
MSTFAFDEFTVTTWGQVGGQQQWRVRRGEQTVEFLAPRDTPMQELYELGQAALIDGQEGP